MDNVRNLFEKINTRVCFDEPMQLHSSFQIGGPADYYSRPSSTESLVELLRAAGDGGIPITVIGGGTNLLVADVGVRGLVLDMSGLNGIEIDKERMRCGAGVAAGDAAQRAADSGLGGIDFMYSLPGTIGGAVYMNARCYGSQVSDVLVSVEYFDNDLVLRDLDVGKGGFDYKMTPFMSGAVGKAVITSAVFRLHWEDSRSILKRMAAYHSDRVAKGHFRAPCAGSIFKNDRRLGAPTGKIIDELGLKGKRIGDAAIAEYHGNIIINMGRATALDVLALIEFMEGKMYGVYGVVPEREIRLIGDWKAAAGRSKE